MYSFDESQFSSGQNSAQEKKYFCFCQKVFATYPGIYQHLKSKHENLFEIYKKMKIQKMLKKSRDSKGTFIYKLMKLSQEDICQGKLVQKNKKTTPYGSTKNRKQTANQPQNGQIVDNQRTSIKASSRESQQNKIDIQYPNQQIQSKKSGASHEIKNKNFTALNNLAEGTAHYPPHFPYYTPQLFPPFPPMFPNFQLTIKAFLVRFLYQSPESHRGQTKSYLYDLMIFIDKNRHLTKDPRIEGRLFLSYCDQFDPQYIGILLAQFIEKLESELRQRQEQFTGQQVYNKKLKIYCVKAFGNWLNQAGFLRSQKPYMSQIKQDEELELKAKEQEVIE